MSHVQLSTSAQERLVARRTFPLHRRTSVCRNLFGPVDHDELSRDMKAKLQEISERDQQRWNFNFDTNTPLDGDYEWEEVPADKSPAFYQDSVQNGRTRVPATPVKRRPSSDSSAPTEPLVRADVLERLAVPESSGSSGPCPAEVNQENRTDKLNSGKTTHKQVPCPARKTSTVTETTTHITGNFYFIVFKESAGKIEAAVFLHVLKNTTLNSFFFFLIDFFAKRKRAADKKSNDMSACHLSKSPIPVEQTPRKRIR